MRGTPLLIVFEGIDFSGKRTQAELLAEYLKSKGYSISLYSFPDYTTTTGKILEEYLTMKRNLDSRIVAMLYAINRLEKLKEIEKDIEENKIIIFDRYIYSNMAYQMANGLDLEWLRMLDIYMPRPDLVIFLKISPEEALKRKGECDRYEKLEFLRKVERIYEKMANGEIKTNVKWYIVDGSKSIGEIHKKVVEIVEKFL